MQHRNTEKIRARSSGGSSVSLLKRRSIANKDYCVFVVLFLAIKNSSPPNVPTTREGAVDPSNSFRSPLVRDNETLPEVQTPIRSLHASPVLFVLGTDVFQNV